MRMTISIHAPRGGSDGLLWNGRGISSNFNPRSPWGERLLQIFADAGTLVFQSTLPVGGATKPTFLQRNLTEFQSTLPVGGATRKCFPST